MAEYFSLISRAVAGLEQSTGENRRVLYERARSALINQLRGIEPPLDEADITRERLALEEAIRKVEAEESSRSPAPPPEPEPEEKPEPPQPDSISLRDQALRNFRETMAEAEGLGDATAKANRSAHDTYQAVPGGHPAQHAPDSDKAGPETHYFEPPPDKPFEHEHAEFAGNGFEAEDTDGKPAAYEDQDETAYPPARHYGRLIAIIVLILAVLGIAGIGYWQRGAISSMVARLHSQPSNSTTAPTAKNAPPAAGSPKITDRIGPSNVAGNESKPANAPAAAVAQKVVLYEEDPSNPQGKRYVGSAIWRTETVSPGQGLAPELGIRADVEIPERHMRMTWSLRRNTDKALPASHTIEIMFTLPADFDQGGIGNVPGVLMKETEQARGVPLAGLSVKVTNGYFLIGLSAVSVDVQRNIKLLKERDWFDIPIVYTSGKRAILAVEKGTPGARAFEEAFRAWGE
jgi:hypothetical protein